MRFPASPSLALCLALAGGCGDARLDSKESGIATPTAGAAREAAGDSAGSRTDTNDPAAAHPDANADPAPHADAPPGAQPGERPLAFDLPLAGAGGGRSRLADYTGKVVLVTFWASWCGPCRLEVPALEKPYKELRDAGLVVVGISIDEDEAAARSFLSMFPVSYPMALDAGGGTVADAWGVSSIPATVLIGKDGLVVKRHLGYAPTMLANTVNDIRALLQE